MSSLLWLPVVAGAIAVLYGFIANRQLMALPMGNAKMQEIAGAIQEGANAYLKRQYATIAWAGLVVAVLLIFFFQNWQAPLGFIIGAVLSGAAASSE